MNAGVYDEARSCLREFLTTIIHDSVIYVDYAHRSTVTKQDVCHALKRNGVTLYGFV